MNLKKKTHFRSALCRADFCNNILHFQTRNESCIGAHPLASCCCCSVTHVDEIMSHTWMRSCHTHEWNDVPWMRLCHAYVMRHVDAFFFLRRTNTCVSLHTNCVVARGFVMWILYVRGRDICGSLHIPYHPGAGINLLSCHTYELRRVMHLNAPYFSVQALYHTAVALAAMAQIVTHIHSSWLRYTVRDSYTVGHSYTYLVTHSHNSWLRYTVRDSLLHNSWLVHSVRESYTQFVTQIQLIPRIQTSWLIHTVRDWDTQFVTHMYSSCLIHTVRDSYTWFVTQI